MSVFTHASARSHHVHMPKTETQNDECMKGKRQRLAPRLLLHLYKQRINRSRLRLSIMLSLPPASLGAGQAPAALVPAPSHALSSPHSHRPISPTENPL